MTANNANPWLPGYHHQIFETGREKIEWTFNVAETHAEEDRSVVRSFFITVLGDIGAGNKTNTPSLS